MQKLDDFYQQLFEKSALHLFVTPGHKINKSHFFYSMRMRQQRHCFSLVQMISEASLPSTSHSRVIRIFRVWWIMNQFSVLAVSWNDLGSSWVLTDRLCHWRASPLHHKLSIYLSESQEVLLAMCLEGYKSFHAKTISYQSFHTKPRVISYQTSSHFVPKWHLLLITILPQCTTLISCIKEK